MATMTRAPTVSRPAASGRRFSWCALAAACVAAVVIACHRAPAPRSSASRLAVLPRVVILPRGDLRPVAREADGWVDLTWGGVRVQALDDAVRVAEGRLAQPIRCTWRVTHGWVFLAADGVVAESDTFLGPLHRTGDLAELRPGMSCGLQRGRVAIVSREGAVWSTEGNGLARVRGLGAAEAVDAYFLDAQRGLAHLVGDVVLVTRDGGGRWEVLTSGDEDRARQAASVLYEGGPDGGRDDMGPATLREGQREAVMLRLVAQEPAAIAELMCSLTDVNYNATVSADASAHFAATYAREAVFSTYDTAFGA